MLSFFIGYVALVNVSYPTSITPSFYIENLYLPIAVFLALPFVVDILPVLHSKKIAVPVFCIILLSGSIRLYTTHYTYAKRLNWERALLDEYRNKKVLISTNKADADILQILWGTPYEFWLLSTSEQGETASIIIDDHPEHRNWATDLPKSFVVNWDIVPYKKLNPRYFHFTDTVTGYTIIR